MDILRTVQPAYGLPKEGDSLGKRKPFVLWSDLLSMESQLPAAGVRVGGQVRARPEAGRSLCKPTWAHVVLPILLAETWGRVRIRDF